MSLGEQSLSTFVPGPAQNKEVGNNNNNNKDIRENLPIPFSGNPNNEVFNHILHINKQEFNGTKTKTALKREIKIQRKVEN